MQLFLLTHLRETFKHSNTGQLVQLTLQEFCRTIIWERKRPDTDLLKLIENNKVALVYPANEDDEVKNINDYDHFIIIDSTWQQARKIMNKSPYLQRLPRIALTQKNSTYQLRRNQIAEGLCTAEVAIDLLKQNNEIALANDLQNKFSNFNMKNSQEI